MGDRAGRHESGVRGPALSADESEAALIARLTGHEVLAEIEARSREELLEILLQRRFLSLVFPVVYDMGIDGLSDPGARMVVREILREEYPDPSGETPSHREDLVTDLLALGATRAEILASRPTEMTSGVIEDALALALDAAAEGDDLGVLTILRFWGEVVVSVEYGELWRRMEPEFEAAGQRSCFYSPHHHHDGREPLATSGASSTTHSGRLGACLARLLSDDAAYERFTRTEERVLAGRLRFYDQFALRRSA